MSTQEIFQAFGGGIAGLLAIAVVGMAWKIVAMYEARIVEHREAIATKDSQISAQTAAINRLADAVEAQIGRRLKSS